MAGVPRNCLCYSSALGNELVLTALLEGRAKARDRKRLHAWAAVGYNFKSDMIWYDVPGNSNGKMSLKVYRDEILEPVVGSWLREGHQFVLEEDGDSGHGTSSSNIVRTWKRDIGLESFFNCSGSPDFSPIERAWQAPKQAVKKRPCWDDEIVKELAEEGWTDLKPDTINGWIDQIPVYLQRLYTIGRPNDWPLVWNPVAGQKASKRGCN